MRAFGDVLLAELTRQADRAFVWLVVAFAAGAALFFAWQDDPSVWMTLAMVSAGAVLFAARGKIPAASFTGLVLIALGLGHGAAEWRTARVATPSLERESRAFMLTATVVEAERRPDGNRIVVTDFTLPDVAAEATPKRLRISLPSAHGLPNVGERIRVRAVVRPAALPVMPDGFQFQRFLYFDGIGGVSYAVGPWQLDDAKTASGLPARFHAWAEGLRRAIGARITAVLPGPDGTVAGALVNGEQNAIPEDLQEAYRIAGIAHLLSISGVHMSLLAGTLFFLVRRLLALVPAIALRVNTKKIAAIAGLAATAFYLIISGMSVPAVRSFLMIAVLMAAILLDRTALSLRTISWAALVLLVIFPDAIFGASFQMSFLAVLGLVALYEQSWLRIGWRNADGDLRVLRVVGIYLIGLVVTDLVAGGATALFAAYHFNRLPTYSAVTNLLAVPLTGLWIMPAAMLSLVLMPLGWDEVPLKIMGAGVTVLDDVARAVAGWPHAQVHVPPMATGAMALGALGIVFVCIWRGPRRWLGFILVAPAVLQPFLAPPPDVLVDETARVFAVSDADGHLITRPGRAGRFVRDAWTERYGKSLMPWPKPGEGDLALGLICDADGCMIARNGRRLLLAFTPTALAEDCGQTDAIISATAARDLCRDGRIIDIVDLRRDGAVEVWLESDGVRTRSVRESTGDRVWMRGVRESEPEDDSVTDQLHE